MRQKLAQLRPKPKQEPVIRFETSRAPLELFMAEEPHRLQGLPRHPYDTAEVGFRLCSMEGFIEWMTNRYSVPFDHVGDIMTVKATEDQIIVYSPEDEPDRYKEDDDETKHSPARGCGHDQDAEANQGVSDHTEAGCDTGPGGGGTGPSEQG